MVVDANGTFGDLVQTLGGFLQSVTTLGTGMFGANLVNDPQALPEFLYTADVTVIAVPV